MTGETAYLVEAALVHGVDASRLRIERVRGPGGREGLSALRYGSAGDGEPRIALLHGGGQNAHTWDLVMAALGLPGLALDLPGHGHSPWTIDADHAPRRLAGATARALRALAPDVPVLVGMSLGGMVAAAVAEGMPGLEHLVLVDVTPASVVPPGSTVGAVAALLPAGLDELVRRVHELSPERDPAPLRHSIWHATRALPDGRRTWRADPRGRVGSFRDLWPEVERSAARTTMVLAERGSFVPPEDVARMRRLLGDDRVRTVPGSSHSVQSTCPGALAEILRELVDG